MTAQDVREVRESRRDRVVRLTAQDLSAADIAAIVGCSQRTVVRDRAARKVAKPKVPLLTGEQLALAGRLVEDGCSHMEVARTIGCSQTAITHHFPGTQWTPSQAGTFAVLVRSARQTERRRRAG